MKTTLFIMGLLAISSDAAGAGTVAYITLVGGSCTRPAKKMASEVFRKAGVSIVWGSPMHAEPQKSWLEVRIEEGLPNAVLPGALAVSHPYGACSKGVTVFMDRIRARTRRLDRENALLAYVLVHEITHVIQGVYRHSEEGVMKARWDSLDYAAIFDRRLGFMEQDLILLRQGLAVGWCRLPRELTRLSRSQTSSHQE